MSWAVMKGSSWCEAELAPLGLEDNLGAVGTYLL
jgi:hypothetical protein